MDKSIFLENALSNQEFPNQLIQLQQV